MKFSIAFMLIGLLALTSCGLQNDKTPADTPQTTAEDILDTNWDTMTVQTWDSVRVHYTGTLDDGSVFDSSRERDQTLDFQVGGGQMIAGFDAGIIGMAEWETKILTLSPSEAYGERDETLVEIVPKSDLQDFVNAGYELKAGEKIPTQIGELTIIDADEENVTLDVNHPLAGQTLTFEVELVEIVR